MAEKPDERYDDCHVGSADCRLRDAVGKERSEAYKLSLQGWLDLNMYRLNRAEYLLLKASARHATKEEIRGYCAEAAKLIQQVQKEFHG